MADNTEMAENFLNPELTGKIKSEFLELYPKMGEQLSVSIFDEFLGVLIEEGVAFKVDSSMDGFRKRLVDDLSGQFGKMWERQSIDHSLSVLDILKNKYINQPPSLAPTAKTPQEQTSSLRIRMLQKKIAYFEKQLAFQKKQLETLVPSIEQSRKVIEELTRRQEVFSFQMDTRLEHMCAQKDEIKKLHLQVNETNGV